MRFFGHIRQYVKAFTFIFSITTVNSLEIMVQLVGVVLMANCVMK